MLRILIPLIINCTIVVTYQRSEGGCGDVEVVICNRKRPRGDGAEADTREDVPVFNEVHSNQKYDTKQ